MGQYQKDRSDTLYTNVGKPVGLSGEQARVALAAYGEQKMAAATARPTPGNLFGHSVFRL